MDKSTYMELLASKPKEISLTDEQVKSWVDDICDAINALNECLYELQYGEYIKTLNHYDRSIMVCGMNLAIAQFPDVQIYKGIEVMARATKSKLQLLHDQDIEYPYRYSFRYRGVKFYQLEDGELGEGQA